MKHIRIIFVCCFFLLLLTGCASKTENLTVYYVHENPCESCRKFDEFLEWFQTEAIPDDIKADLEYREINMFRQGAEERFSELCEDLNIDPQKNYTHSEMANYLLGAVLEQDLRALQASKFINPESQPYIILSGKKFFCQAFQSIFNLDKRFSDFVIHWEQPAIPLSAQGALKIYQYRLSN